MEKDTKSRVRYNILDSLRGITLISMILFHTVWDIVYIYRVDWDWFRTDAAYLWQQSICWTFIFLSGFCWSLGKKKLKRGAIVFMAGVLVSAVTLIFMPEERVICGVLTLIGSGMLLLTPLERYLQKIPAIGGMITSLLLFFLTRNINHGYLGFEGFNLLKLPTDMYRNTLTTYIGLPPADFYSADYFSLFPWIFLYIAGYFAYRIIKQKNYLSHLQGISIPPLEWLGRHSLIIYLLHQPIVYGVLMLLFS